jgi:hypothetical protein
MRVRLQHVDVRVSSNRRSTRNSLNPSAATMMTVAPRFRSTHEPLITFEACFEQSVYIRTV